MSSMEAEKPRLKMSAPHGRFYQCRCERQVFFRNSLCLGCHAPLGYEPGERRVAALDPGPQPGTWLMPDGTGPFKRCANFDSAAGCNWLIPVGDPDPWCAACRLNRTIPDQSDDENREYWRAIETSKRRLVSQLLALGLPVKSKVSAVNADPQRGLMFDFLRSPPEGPRVMTGHASGLITLNVEEADDAKREKIRRDLREPYRTLLGHLRHEVGHYYWDRLIWDTPWLEPFRATFGDERASYAEGLRRNYEQGPPIDWRDRFISSYASSHPWEDWAESWAHYLHVVDSLDTAIGFGFTAENVPSEVEPFVLDDGYDPKDPDGPRLLGLVNSWLKLTTVLNELARSMGQPDFYPFVMSRPVLKKLHFIHIVVKSAETS